MPRVERVAAAEASTLVVASRKRGWAPPPLAAPVVSDRAWPAPAPAEANTPVGDWGSDWGSSGPRPAAAALSLQRSMDSLPDPTAERFNSGPVAAPEVAADQPAAPASGARAAPPQAAQPAVDVEELVERALQALMFRLDIERERRGFTRWT